MILARVLSKHPNFHDISQKNYKIPEFYMTFAR